MLGLRAVDLEKVSALLDNTKFAPDDAASRWSLSRTSKARRCRPARRDAGDQSEVRSRDRQAGLEMPKPSAHCRWRTSAAAVAHLEAAGALPPRASKEAASSIETMMSGDEETPRAPDPEVVDRLINGGSAPRGSKQRPY